MYRHFAKEGVQKDNQHTKGCSTSLVTREMQVNITMRYYLISTGLAIKKKTKASLAKDVEGLGSSYIAGGNIKWFICFGKLSCSSSKCETQSYHMPRNSTPRVYTQEK